MGMMQEFREFAVRDGVVDMAAGIVVEGAESRFVTIRRGGVARRNQRYPETTGLKKRKSEGRQP